MMKAISTKTLESRYQRIVDMQKADRNRFKPNPRGDGYLTRNERYNELRWMIEPELKARYSCN